MSSMHFSGLESVLKSFDSHGWQGTFSSGNWRISNGGYDLWFELSYNGQVVAQCNAGEVCTDFSPEIPEKEELIKRILSAYAHLTVKRPSLQERLQSCTACDEEPHAICKVKQQNAEFDR